MSGRQIEGDVYRRRFLKLTAGSTPIIAGCSSKQGQERTTASTPIDSPTETLTETSAEKLGDIFIDPDGNDRNDGSSQNPLATIQEGLNRARPGETVYVNSGKYLQSFSSERHGKPDAPITVTGPPDAVVKGIGMEAKEFDVVGVFRILHHHIHLTGLTFDGLWNPSKPNDPESYRRMLIRSEGSANKTGSDYLEGIRIAPHAVGNSRWNLVDLTMTNHAEVGPFRVIGLAGAVYTVGDSTDHRGEIVYIGTPPISFEKGMPIEGPDASHDIYVHHLDNSAGHPHSELVNTKPGTHDITIEYCTDGGGAYDTDGSSNASIAVQGHDTIIRWNDLRGGGKPSSANGVTRGIKIDADVPRYCEREDELQQCVGFNNSIYGNRILGFSGKAVGFEANLKESNGQEVPPNVWPEDQKIICGNEYGGETHGDPAKNCPDSVPTGDGIGHLGGDNPWV